MRYGSSAAVSAWTNRILPAKGSSRIVTVACVEVSGPANALVHGFAAFGQRVVDGKHVDLEVGVVGNHQRIGVVDLRRGRRLRSTTVPARSATSSPGRVSRRRRRWRRSAT